MIIRPRLQFTECYDIILLCYDIILLWLHFGCTLWHHHFILNIMTSFCLSICHYVSAIGSRTQRHIFQLFLPNPGRILPALTFNGPEFGRICWITEKLYWVGWFGCKSLWWTVESWQQFLWFLVMVPIQDAWQYLQYENWYKLIGVQCPSVLTFKWFLESNIFTVNSQMFGPKQFANQ